MYSERHLSKSELRSCMDLGKALTSELDPDRLFNVILSKLANLVPADVLALLLFVRNDSCLQLASSIGLRVESGETIRIARGEQIAGRVAHTGVPEALESSKQSLIREAWLEELVGHATKSVICAPLIFGNRILGVIEAFNVHRNLRKALSIMMFVADYAAIAVENTRRYQEIQDLANRDNLTGLYNTRYLYTALESLCEEHKNSRSPFSLIFMDLDNFKQTVDTRIDRLFKVIEIHKDETEGGAGIFMLLTEGFERRVQISCVVKPGKIVAVREILDLLVSSRVFDGNRGVIRNEHHDRKSLSQIPMHIECLDDAEDAVAEYERRTDHRFCGMPDKFFKPRLPYQ